MRPDVVVVGAGATGLTMAALLGAWNIGVLLLEKRWRLPPHPQAHFLNHRTMEIVRPFTRLAEEITKGGPPLNEWRRFVYAETLSRGIYGQVDHFTGQTSHLTRFSPEPVAHFSQNKLLPLLLERVRRLPSVKVEFQRAVLECSSIKSGVNVRYNDGSDIQEVHAQYAVIANGSNSDIVHRLNIPFQGTKEIQNLISVHFFSQQLSKILKADPAMLYFVFNREVVLVVVAHDLKGGEFVAQIPFFPPVQQPSDFDNNTCAHLICSAAGCQISDLEIASVKPWIMKTQVATTYQKGHVFLAGDAAHVFPPAGGFGMNTGIQDAHNLAWKLASVLTGSHSKTLLSSYTTERRPIAIQNSKLSLNNWREATSIPAALGLDPRYARLLQDASTVVDSILPRSLSRLFLESSLSLGQDSIKHPFLIMICLTGRHLSGLHGPLHLWRQQRLKEIFASGQTLRLQFLKEDLGFIYSDSNTDRDADHSRNAEFVPEVVMHGRLPHTVVQLIPSQRHVSSLDFISWSGLQSTVFLVGGDGAYSHATILKHLKNVIQVPIMIVVLLDIHPSIHNQTGKPRTPVYIPFISFEELDDEECRQLDSDIYLFEGRDMDGSLIHAMRSADVSAVVVRPDGHIASLHKAPPSMSA